MNKVMAMLTGIGLAIGGVAVAPAAQAAVTAPSTPTAVRGAPGNLTATILWAPPKSTGGSPITSYHLYSNGVSKEVSATTRRFTFTKLRAGFTYKLYVSARNAKGRSVETVVAVKVYPEVRKYANCTDMNRVYLHGAGRSSAVVDKTPGERVRTFYVSAALYDLNTGSDRDKDGIACEKL